MLKALGAALFSFLLVPPAYAEIKTDGAVILQYIHEDNRDLGSSDALPSDSLAEQLQIGVRNNLDKYRYWVGRARYFNINSHNLDRTDEGDPSNPIVKGDDQFLELRELYYAQKNIWPGTELKIGRQRLREPRALWWNADSDLIRLSYKDKKNAGFIAAGEDLGSYRTGTEEFARDKNRFRVLGEYSYEYRPQHKIEPRFVFEHDHSDGHETGALISYDDIDREDLTGAYFGLRGTGIFDDLDGYKIAYRGDVIGLAGRQDVEEEQSSGGAYLINSQERNSVRAWVLDGGIAVMPWQEGFVLRVGYAMGSGDKPGGHDTQFRQTGLEGGSSRMELERQAQRNYGEVFRPELSNIQIANVAAAYPVSSALELGLSYFHYTQIEKDNDVRRSGLRADPNGLDASLGQEIDVSAVTNLDKVLPVSGVTWRNVGGMFMPGDAYDDNDDAALRLFSEVRIRF